MNRARRMEIIVLGAGYLLLLQKKKKKKNIDGEWLTCFEGKQWVQGATTECRSAEICTSSNGCTLAHFQILTNSAAVTRQCRDCGCSNSSCRGCRVPLQSVAAQSAVYAGYMYFLSFPNFNELSCQLSRNASTLRALKRLRILWCSDNLSDDIHSSSMRLFLIISAHRMVHTWRILILVRSSMFIKPGTGFTLIMLK